MRSTAAIVILLVTAAARTAWAQDPPPTPQEQAEEEVAPSPWFRQPNTGYGPFHYTSMAVFPSLRAGFEPRFPSTLPSGGFEFRFGESWVKNLSDEDSWRIDFELVRTSLVFSWGLSDDVQVDLAIDSGERTGGTLDAFILGFHQAFGLALGSRANFARDENRIEIQPPDGGPRIVVDKSDPQPYEQAMLFSFQHTLTHGDEDYPAIAWSLCLRTHLDGGDVDPSGSVDVAASIGFSKKFDDVVLYLGGNVAWFGREEFFGLPLRPIQWSATFAAELNAFPSFSLIAQYVVTSGGVDRLSDLSRPAHEIVAGFKWEAWRGVLIEAAVIENIVNFQNSPDFGVHVGLTLRW